MDTIEVMHPGLRRLVGLLIHIRRGWVPQGIG